MKTRGELNELRRKVRKLVRLGRLADSFLVLERDHYRLTWSRRYIPRKPSSVVLALESVMEEAVQKETQPGELL